MTRTFATFALLLAACGGSTEPTPSTDGTRDTDRSEPSSAQPAASGSAKTPSSKPCQYDRPPPANPEGCPKTWVDACRAAHSTFTCPVEKLDCWYANVGDEVAPGCYAHGLMSCGEWPSADGGTRIEARCAQ